MALSSSTSRALNGDSVFAPVVHAGLSDFSVCVISCAD